MRYALFSISLFLTVTLVCFINGCKTGNDVSPGPVESQVEWEKRVKENYSDWKPGTAAPGPENVKFSKTPVPGHVSALSVYKAGKGDTLFSISKKFYKDSAKWKLIYEANRNILPTPESIKPGMELRIPPLK